MTTSNQITLDHIKSYFSLYEPVEEIDIAPSATGGAGINNLDEFPPPKPVLPSPKPKGTEYVKKYLDKHNQVHQVQNQIKRTVLLPGGSTVSINALEDVEDLSTAVGDLPTVNELENEATENIYATYYNVPDRIYDPDLTITKYREEILQQLNINPVVIIQGPTGCGKTTQVPQYILDYYASRGKYCNIIVTQPRKIAAISIARRVCQERRWQLGSLVGYQVAMDPKVSSDTRLSYVTTGILLEKFVTNKRMDMYTHVIIDEVHERDQDVDFALLLVKKFLLTNSQRVKVVLMSATFDSSMFAKYFALSSKGDPAPIIEVTGKSKEVTEHYLHELKTLTTKIPEFDVYNPTIDPCLYDTVVNLMYVFDRIEKAEQNVPPENDYAPARGAVLIFLPGYDEICALTDKLKTARFNKKFWVLPLHSTVTVEEQTKVFRESPPDHRKVILSTNIAESSITVPDVKYVIDYCLTKSLVTDPYTNYTCLQLEWASKSNCIQRKGRAGRVDIGKVYRMVPKQFYEALPEYGIPEIKRCPLTNTILHLKKLDLCEPLEMLAFALEPPYLADIENAVIVLKEVLALTGKPNNPCDGDLTFMGRVMANLPLDVKLSKLILFGYAFQYLEECIIIAACLSLQTFFAKPFQKALDAYRSRLAWADNKFSDCLAHLFAYKKWKLLSLQGQFLRPGGLGEREWGDSRFIQIRRIKEVDVLVKELKSRLEKFNITVARPRQDCSSDSDVFMLKIIMAGAFFPHYYLQGKLEEKEIMREINGNDPHSSVIISGLPANHGLLYACALKDMLSCCNDKIDIDFEERKAYIKFEKSHDIPSNEVLKSVYVAVKMRQLRIPMELSVFSNEDAENKLKQIKQLMRTSSANRLSSTRFTVTLNPPSSLKKVPLPDPSINICSIFISHINNCGHFWARYASQEYTNILRNLELALNVNPENLKPITELETNQLCLAPFHKGSGLYYRAQVQEIGRGKGKVKVFFVDYGNVEIVNTDNLREIDENMSDALNTPAVAFECQLSEVKPSVHKNPSGMWCNAANSWFFKAVNGEILKAKIYSVVQGIVRLELLKDTRDRIILSINQQLINIGYAETAEESFASKQNHEFRLRCSDYDANAISADSFAAAVQFSLEDAKGFSNIRPTNRKIRLHGPFNPLEVSYLGLTNLDRFKCVKVERDSVNSISFNAEPEDTCTHMLIAASVSIGQRTDQLQARNTTLMPKILGLPSLLCLIFSPYAEIRTNKERTCYIGALCGLGFDPASGEPLNPDHDIEIAFDAEINDEDIKNVNEIRMTINVLLQNECDLYESSKPVLYEGLRKTVYSILQKKRNSRTPEYYSKCGQWNQIPPELLLHPSVDISTDGFTRILPLHYACKLMKGGPEIEKLKKHLEELYTMIDTETSKEFRMIRCEFCSKDLRSTRDLLLHLDSKGHVNKEREFHKLISES